MGIESHAPYQLGSGWPTINGGVVDSCFVDPDLGAGVSTPNTFKRSPSHGPAAAYGVAVGVPNSTPVFLPSRKCSSQPSLILEFLIFSGYTHGLDRLVLFNRSIVFVLRALAECIHDHRFFQIDIFSCARFQPMLQSPSIILQPAASFHGRKRFFSGS
jgi:hypothetical protein